ncbi:plasmid mobilization relaxosome protein MobC [Flavobacterium sp. HJSW_4]|uniref:plasmid mobilization protein n=1 Tax=Flavobacterium sp. HJSW_4 TaxID=3344660 RepID=UPI0035F22E2F
MMERENSNRSRRITLRLTEKEYAKIESLFKASTCRKLSDYVRKSLFSRPITSTYRNQSLDDLMEETVVLCSELRAIGNNINQIARKINTLKTVPEFKGHLYLFEIQRERLFDKMEEVSGHTQKIAEKWLQS